LCAFTKLWRVIVCNVCPSISLHGTAQLPLDRFLWNFCTGKGGLFTAIR
jgi:hypothetical protein